MQEIIIVAIVFGSILAMIKLILDHAAARRTSSSDRSLTTGELEGLIDEAVEQSTRDLRLRVENLEAIATEDSPPVGRRLLEDPSPYGDVVEGDEARETRRARS